MKKKDNKRNFVQLARKISQLLFIGLLVAGVYMDLRMVFIIFLPAALLFGNFFCGWVCPFGATQEFMAMIGKKILGGKQLKMPRKIHKYLQYLRYVLFAILMIGIADVILTPLNGYGTFMGLFSGNMETIVMSLSLGIMIVYLILSLFFERAFCNYLCTEAAKYGILSMTRIFSIKRDESSCIGCKKCDKTCPMNIEVSLHDQIRNGQCINCMQCISACPTAEKTLSYGFVKWSTGKNRKKNGENEAE